MWPIGTWSSRQARIERHPHRARDVTVERRHGVGAPRRLQRQHRHAERLVRVVRVDAAEPHERFVAAGPSASRSGPRCSSTRAGENRSWPAGTGVCVVNTTCAATRRSASAESMPSVLHPPSHQLQHGKRAVSLVEVHHARRDAERRERLHAADAEQQLLPDAHALVTAVQPRRQLAVFRAVAFDVRVEQQERVAAHGDPPHARDDAPGPRLDLDQ